MEGLLESVRETRNSLVDKRDFLEDQKEEYVKIRAHLVQLPDYSKPVSKNNAEVKGLVLGDVIISRVFEGDEVVSYRVFVNIGCEYFIERDKKFAVGFIEDKIGLIEEAIERFNDKINEANNTEKNLKETIEYEEASRRPESKIEEINESDDDEYEDGLPPMEIREELDEDGNVINSSVTRAATKKQAMEIHEQMVSQEQNIQQQEDKTKESDFEKNLKGKLAAKPKNLHSAKIKDNINSSHIESNEPVLADQFSTLEDSDSQTRSLATDNIYTFADLVEQIDKDDGDFDSEVDIDNESFNKWEINEQAFNDDFDDDESDDEIYDDDKYDGFSVAASVVPGRAQSSFMEQIQKLRNQKKDPSSNSENSDTKIKEEAIKTGDKSVNLGKGVTKAKSDIQNSEPTTSIMKKTSKSKKKKKKSVGFAKSLQIHEVESFKEENKKQMHRFNPANMFDMESYEPENANPDDPSSTADFDSDLFAQLIGAKEADEIHDKYVEDYENQMRTEQENKKKNRVSRFKASLKENESSYPAKTKNDKSPKKYKQVNDKADISTEYNKETPLTDDIVESVREDEMVERTVEDEVIERAVEDEVIEKAVEDEVIERTVEDEVIERAVEDEVIERAVEDEVIERAVEDEVIERAVKDEVIERSVEDVDRKPRISRFTARSKKAPKVQSHKSIRNGKKEEKESEDIPNTRRRRSAFKQRTQDKQETKPAQSAYNEPIEKFEQLERAEIEELGRDNIIVEKEIRGGEESSFSCDKVEEKQSSSKKDLPVMPKELKEYLEKGEAKDKFNKARVDFQSLGENLDDMAVAYSMGLYDDDVEDPGTIIEHVKDFENYNKEVKSLEGDIREFRLNNPMQVEEDDDDAPMMTDIKENDIPENYSSDGEEDYSLSADSLSHSIALEYRNKKEQMINTLAAEMPIIEQDEDQRQFEPIDENGNPIKQSRFRSQRTQLGKLIQHQ
ncbi:prefoldin-like protein [Nakaseomyces bracarensis]|uniref:prefoldin-like protein n=1 Tax=Nakaseomyces bracarensis TaxID=273131 RepID=UPI0038710E54